MKKKYSSLLFATLTFLELFGIYSSNVLANNLFLQNKQNKQFVKSTPRKEKVNSLSLAIGNNELGELLKNNINNSNYGVMNYVFNNIKANKFFVEVISDTQYEIGDKVFAEGSVNILFNNGRLIGDKISFDKVNKELKAEGNIKFYKGEQYIESDYLVYNFNNGKGFIKNVYGILDLQNAKKDFDIDIGEIDKNISYDQNFNESNIRYKSKTNIALENKFSDNNNLNISDLDLNIPQITKWRYKSDFISIGEEILKSEEIIFTNDPINKPQFLLRSRNLTVEIIDQKLKLISRNTRLIFDDKLSFPIGRRSIFDGDAITRWSLGSESEKDGIYISRGFNLFRIFNDFSLNITPYFLIQRTLKGSTSAFVKNEDSILSNKVKQDIYFLDNFGLETKLSGPINKWNFNFKSEFDSLNPERLANATRLLVTLDKSIDLNAYKKNIFIKENDNKKFLFDNFFDIKFYGAYRKTIEKGFAGDSEIYLGKGITLNNRRSWLINDKINKLILSYDLGEFTGEAKDLNELKTLTRNVFNANFVHEFKIWEKDNIDKEIDLNYKYSPKVIKQGFSWITNINSGLFFYSDNSRQDSISITSGPQLILGSLKNKYLDYSKINLAFTTIAKSGESPFKFDDIDKTQRLKFIIDQQIIGPLLFSYEGYLNLDNRSNNYGNISQQTFGLDLKRRAYTIGAFYRASDDTLGIKFNIFNFGYDGRSSKF